MTNTLQRTVNVCVPLPILALPAGYLLGTYFNVGTSLYEMVVIFLCIAIFILAFVVPYVIWGKRPWDWFKRKTKISELPPADDPSWDYEPPRGIDAYPKPVSLFGPGSEHEITYVPPKLDRATARNIINER